MTFDNCIHALNNPIKNIKHFHHFERFFFLFTPASTFHHYRFVFIFRVLYIFYVFFRILYIKYIILYIL